MQVRISQPAKSVMQSASKNNRWLLEFVPLRYSKFHEPIMGWTASKDMHTQLKLWFDTKKQAVDYAKQHCLEYEIIAPWHVPIIPKNYASNFK